MSTDIALIEIKNPLVVFSTPQGLDPVIDAIEKEAKSLHADISTEDGRDAIRSMAYKIAQSKTALDNMGKNLTEDQRKQIDAVNAERKRAKERLQALQDSIRKPLTDWEQEEENRVKEHEAALEHIESLSVFHTGWPTVAEVNERAEQFGKLAPRNWQEFDTRYNYTVKTVSDALEKLLSDARKRENEAAELERLRAEEAARKQKEHEERIAKEAAERARIESEAKAKAEAEALATKVEQERLAIIREKEESEAKAKAEAEALATKVEQERLAIIREKEESEAKAKAEAEALATKVEQERLAIIREKEESEAKAKAEAEALATKVEQERLAIIREKEESEAKAKAEAEALATKVEQERLAIIREKEESEAKAKKAETDAELQRLAAEGREKLAKIQAGKDAEAAAQKEREKIAAEKKAEADALAKREADKNHRAKINNEALHGILSVIFSQPPEECTEAQKNTGKNLIKAIAQGQISHVKIGY